MKHLKMCVFVLVLLISKNGFSSYKVCGQKTSSTGYVSTQCFTFKGECDDGRALTAFEWYFPGGWTCKDLGIVVGDDGTAQSSRSKSSAFGDDGSVHLIRSQDGSAYVTVDGEKAQIRSDAHLEFIKNLEQETARGRVNIQTIQSQIDMFLETDNGFVSDARLKEFSMELGVAIEVEGSPNPGVDSGTGRPSASVPDNATSVETKTVKKDNSGAYVSRRANECSLPDCSCRVVSSSGDSLCEGGTEEETAAGIHFCKCGKFGASSAQAGGTGGDFTAGNSLGASARPAAGQQGRGTPETCVAEYEAAIGTEVFFRPDRKITGVWKAKPGPRTRFQKPGAIVADANGCLYGCTGNVWEPLDCPGRDFSNPETYPLNFKMAAPCGSTNTFSLAWHRLNESRGGAIEATPQEVPLSRFALIQQTSRPMENHDPGDEPTTRQVVCHVDENPNGMFPKLRCCSFETQPTDPGPGMSPINAPDPPLCTSVSQRSAAMPDVQDGSIVLRAADGKDYCLSPNGSFGACAAKRGINENGIR